MEVLVLFVSEGAGASSDVFDNNHQNQSEIKKLSVDTSQRRIVRADNRFQPASNQEPTWMSGGVNLTQHRPRYSLMWSQQYRG